MRYFSIAFLIVVVGFPTAALAFYKPTRVLVPQFFGVTCPTANICIDDLNKLEQAKELRNEAVDFVNSNVGTILNPPRIVFCSTQKCAESFGQYHAAAYNVATVGIVIRTQGWEKHFVRHELIHHLQNERLGSINAFLNTPPWFFEGMAYSLSGDPRRPIPNKLLEAYRHGFEKWHDGSDVWPRAQKLNKESRP